MELPINAKIESILFWKGEPLTVKELSKILSVEESFIQQGLLVLEEKLKDRGLSLIREDDTVLLVTHQAVADIITELNKEELTKDLSKASLETLSIILYRGPMKRSEIDYIRGVNSQFILRNLSIRGLIEKQISPNDERSYTYSPSIDLLRFLGISKKEDLPDYHSVNKDIEGFMNFTEESKESD